MGAAPFAATIEKVRKDVERWNGRFLVCPGTILSQSDGDKHYIDAHSLIKLYNVDPRLCNIDSGNPRYVQERDRFIILSPRFDGNYDLLDAARRSGFILPSAMFGESA